MQNQNPAYFYREIESNGDDLQNTVTSADRFWGVERSQINTPRLDHYYERYTEDLQIDNKDKKLENNYYGTWFQSPQSQKVKNSFNPL